MFKYNETIKSFKETIGTSHNKGNSTYAIYYIQYKF